MTKLLILIFWLAFAVYYVSGQTEEKIQPYACGRTTANLNANHQSAGDNNIILIARLGDGENRTELNRRRLYNAKTYLTTSWNRDPKTIIVAQGERVKGYGRIEVYVNGMMTDVIAVKRNLDLPVGITCDKEDEIFYPRLGEKLRKKKTNLRGGKKKHNKLLDASAKQQLS